MKIRVKRRGVKQVWSSIELSPNEQIWVESEVRIVCSGRGETGGESKIRMKAQYSERK